MILEKGIKVYGDLIERCVEFVNRWWHKEYEKTDVAGLEISTTFIFIHFDKEVYENEAYPISIGIIFK